jgi:hypothetical protein
LESLGDVDKCGISSGKIQAFFPLSFLRLNNKFDLEEVYDGISKNEMKLIN